jgi:predicted signal transduction protein with EAL and GGDEF domain
LSGPIELEGLNISITLSIGIALASDENGADDLLAHADSAMYAAKAQGKARHAVFDPSMRVRVEKRLGVVQPELRAAIEP